MRSLAALALVAFAAACGAPATPTAAGSAPLVVPKVPRRAADGSARPTPPAAPEGLRAVLRVADVEQLAREVATLAGAPGLTPTGILEMIVGDDVARAIDPAASVDALAVGVKDDGGLVASFGLRADGEASLHDAFDARIDHDLAILVPKAGDARRGRLATCALVSTRIVCASEDDTLRETAAYLVTTVRSEPFDGDVRITIPGATVRERTKGHVDEDPLVAELVTGLEREIDRLDLDMRLEPDVDARLTVRLVSRDAPLTRALVPTGRSVEPPPSFFRLPDDALLAMCGAGAAPEDLAPFKQALFADLRASLESDGYVPAAVSASLDELSSLLLTGGPFVLAAGLGAGRDAPQRIAALSDPTHDARSASAARAALAPWVVVGVDEPPRRWIDGIRALVKKNDEAERTRKKPANAASKNPDGDDLAVRITPMPPAAKLPKESLHVELRFTPKKKGSGAPRLAHLYVVPHGDRTWIGYGEDDGAVRERLRITTNDGTDEHTIGRASIGATMKGERAFVGATSTVAGLALLFAPRRDDAQLASAVRRAQGLTALPGAGAEPMVGSIATDPTPGRASLVLRVHGRRSVLNDVVRWLL